MIQSKIERLEFNRGPYKQGIVSRMGVRRGRKGSIRFSSNGRDSARSWHFRKDTWTGSESDRDAIVVRSPRDRGPIMARSWSIRRAIVVDFMHDQGHDHFKFMGHYLRVIVAINSASPPDQTA